MECSRSRSLLVAALVCWAAAPSTAQLPSAMPTAVPSSTSPPQPQPQPQQQPQQQPQSQQSPLQPQFGPRPPLGLPLPLPLSPQNAILLQCRQTVPSTDLDIAEIQRQILPVSLAGQCLLACAAQRLGYMQPNYPLEMQGAGALMNTLYPARGFDPLFQSSLMSTVNQCLLQADPLAQVAYSGQSALNLFNTARQFNPIPGFLG